VRTGTGTKKAAGLRPKGALFRAPRPRGELLRLVPLNGLQGVCMREWDAVQPVQRVMATLAFTAATAMNSLQVIEEEASRESE
jgi:hypothetical protein